MIKAKLAIATLLLLLLAPVGDLAAGSDHDAIRQLLMGTFDRPDARLAVDPIVIAKDHAVADWVQEHRGGRALLKRKNGRWTIVLCSGAAITSAAVLRQAGVPASDAASLAANLESAERLLPAERRALLETVLMGADGGHPRGMHRVGADH